MLKAKGGRTYEPDDFMPKRGQRREQTVEEQLAIVRGIVGTQEQLNGK